ncbi:MAG: GAF domain-containing protein [Paludibacterium sp.]|uniref:GAF domain-containing protein n=1 Tax=Paludibacterium sp. TaxID=1917523 RepID=UPI0025DD4248|nr:GAF domain-containing protein [Paludibacterium sp.]MBV8048864.1 GAF domain-containing protein [Paludibacterium sp.]MBV8646479.1 GAF domain-containing protein [Paludibacterium sp.]
MAENLIIQHDADKPTRYQTLLPQAQALLSGETDLVAGLANVSAMLKMSFDWLWAGFYLVKHDQLVLGPFQGPLACTRIGHGKGVCGSAWARAETLVVPDVDAFPGHIACSSDARSEIVVPLFDARKEVAGVLDIDSVRVGEFDAVDADYLQQLAALITPLFR